MAIVLEGCVTARPAVESGNRHAPRQFVDPAMADPFPPESPVPHPVLLPTPAAGRLNRAMRLQVLLVAIIALATCASTVLATLHLVQVLRQAASAELVSLSLQAVMVYGLFYVLVAGNLAYQCAEYGFIRRAARSLAAPRFVPSDSPLYAADPGETPRAKLLALVPSYKEEPDVVRQTLLSAALAEHPGRRVVLLIDDPPQPALPESATSEAAQGLTACRALPAELQTLFDAEADRIDAALLAWDEADRSVWSVRARAEKAEILAALYESVADWLDRLAERYGPRPGQPASHTDRLFQDKVLRAPALEHRQHAAFLRRWPPRVEGFARETRRLKTLLRVEFSSFERKQFANLSHAPNKAMNLNSYIGLIGASFREQDLPNGRHLLPCDPAEASWQVPPADYIITIDADSLITHDYALRLVALMEQPGNERVAVAQTPYTAVPGAPSALERAAGASTDSQFFTHQGMAHFGASFWVGASALIRHQALRDIAKTVPERGHAVPVFIDDRIQIEDSAATVDLLSKGWQVHHATERLTYSATPANFGALIIQRRRWANGGLLILPRLLRHAVSRTSRDIGSARKIGDALLRVNNLVSAAIAGIGLPLLLICPFDDRLIPFWMPLTVLPYYFLLGWDLKRAGYRLRDIANVYALTILLIPANLAGTLLSLRQAFGGSPIPFQRTPKILGRTRTSSLYIAACCLIPVLGLLQAVSDWMAGYYTHLVYGSLIGLGALYGLIRLIGLRETWDDFRTGLPFARGAGSKLALLAASAVPWVRWGSRRARQM